MDNCTPLTVELRIKWAKIGKSHSALHRLKCSINKVYHHHHHNPVWGNRILTLEGLSVVNQPLHFTEGSLKLRVDGTWPSFHHEVESMRPTTSYPWATHSFPAMSTRSGTWFICGMTMWTSNRGRSSHFSSFLFIFVMLHLDPFKSMWR